MSELEIGGITLDSTFWDVALLVVAFLSFVLLSYLVHFILDRIADSLKRKQRAEVIEHLIGATYRPITLFFLVQGLLAVVVLLGTMERWQDAIGLDEWLTVIYRVWAVLTLLLIASGGARALGVVLSWYGEHHAADEGAILAPSLVNPLRRFANLAIYILAILLSLELLGISVTPAGGWARHWRPGRRAGGAADAVELLRGQLSFPAAESSARVTSSNWRTAFRAM